MVLLYEAFLKVAPVKEHVKQLCMRLNGLQLVPNRYNSSSPGGVPTNKDISFSMLHRSTISVHVGLSLSKFIGPNKEKMLLLVTQHTGVVTFPK